MRHYLVVVREIVRPADGATVRVFLTPAKTWSLELKDAKQFGITDQVAKIVAHEEQARVATPLLPAEGCCGPDGECADVL